MNYQIIIDGVEINANEQLNEMQGNAYIQYVKEKNPRKELASIDLEFIGEEVNLSYHFQPEGFEKIRRITGYLVGTVNRFNNAKQAEEHDRVKHG